MKRLAAALLLVSLTLVAYAGAWRAAFVYDDRPLILKNSRVTQPEAVWRYWTDSRLIGGHELRGFRPLTVASFAWNYRMAGPNPAVFHGTSLAIHILTVLGLWTLIRLLLSAGRSAPAAEAAAVLGAALFAVHPAMTQAVLFLTARSSLIAACGTIWASVCYFIYLYAKDDTSMRRALAYAGVGCAWLVALSGKESAIAGAALFVGIEWCAASSPEQHWTFRGTLRRLAPLAVLGIAYVLWVFLGVQAHSTTPPARGWTANLLGQCAAAWEYTKLIIWPRSLALDHGADHLAATWTWGHTAGLGVVALMIATAIGFRRRAPVVTLGLLGALVVIGPESYALPLKLLVNEHRLYLPGACLAVAAAGGLALVPRASLRAAYGVALVAIVGAGIGTSLRVRTWRTPESLWADAWRKYPSSCRAPAHLGQLALEAGRPDVAVAYLEAATTCNPVRLEPRLLLVTAYSGIDRHGAAVRTARATLVDFPTNATALETVGTALAHAGRVSEAVIFWQQAVDIDPGNNAAVMNLERARGENL